jgi:hypothetical protein
MGALKSLRCARGHKLAGKNLYLRRNGQRECRACSAIRINAWRRKQQSEKVPQSVSMDKSIRVYTSLDEMKNDEYREWHELEPYKRFNAAAELSLSWHGAKESSNNVPRSVQRTLIRIERPPR